MWVWGKEEETLQLGLKKPFYLPLLFHLDKNYPHPQSCFQYKIIPLLFKFSMQNLSLVLHGSPRYYVQFDDSIYFSILQFTDASDFSINARRAEVIMVSPRISRLHTGCERFVKTDFHKSWCNSYVLKCLPWKF